MRFSVSRWVRFVLTVLFCQLLTLICAHANDPLPEINLDNYHYLQLDEASKIKPSEIKIAKLKSIEIRSLYALNEQVKQLVIDSFSEFSVKSLDPWQVGRLSNALEKSLQICGYEKAEVVLLANEQGSLPILSINTHNVYVPTPYSDDVVKHIISQAGEKKSITATGAALRNYIAQEKELLDLFIFKEDEKAIVDEKALDELKKSPEDAIALPSMGGLIAEQKVSELEEAKTKETLNKNLDRAKSAFSYLGSYADADDKEKFLVDTANNYLGGMADRTINDALNNSFTGVNAQLSLGVQELKRINASGKLLVPLYNQWAKIFPYMQTGLTTSPNDRQIAHLGFGMRFYPEAKDLANVGTYMFGINTVFDYDVTRHHKRMSFGVEYMNKYVFLGANYYHRLSNWKGSVDYEKDYVQERPADGFDLHSKFFLPKGKIGRAAVTASVTHWFGDDVSPFGNLDIDKLENDPWIYSVGLEWQPVPAFSIVTKHELSDGFQHNSSINLNFNIPLDDYSIANAFNTDAVNLAGGMDLKTSRSMFIERDYTMPLQYRATPGKYHIEFCGYSGPKNEKLCFFVYDGLKRPASGVTATIKAKDKCVVFDQNGTYITDSSGHFYATILESCVTKTTVYVTVQDSTEEFDIEIKNLTLSISANPERIQRFETSTITIKGKSSASAGIPVSWELQGAGFLTNGQTVFDSSGKATVIYNPDTTLTVKQDVTVIAHVYDNKFAAPVEVYIYGTGGLLISDGIDDNTAIIEGTEIRTITYEDLRPGSIVSFTIEGDGKISENEDGSNPQTTIDIPVGEDGTVTLYVIADNVDSGNIKVTATTEDPYAPPATLDLTVKSYVASSSVSTTAPEVGDPFTVYLTGLKPGTEVSWSDSSYATPSSSTSTVDDNGATQMTYTVGSEQWSGTIDDISFTYYRNVTYTTTDQVQSLVIKEYTPYFGDVSTTFSGDDSITVTLHGGKPGFAVNWSVTNGSLSDTQTVFDENGDATTTLTGISPYTGNAVITTTSMGKTQTYTQDYKNYTLTFTAFTTTNSTYGDTKTNTMDYRNSQTIEVTGGKPNTSVTVTTSNASVILSANSEGVDPFDLNAGVLLAGNGTSNSKTFVLDSDGKGTFEVDAVIDFSIDNFNITAQYYKNSAETLTTSESINMYDYNLSLATSATSIVGNSTFTATLSGGRAGEAVTWSISGSGKITSKSTTFNSSGKATATIQGVSPYSNTIIVGASGISQNKTKNVSIEPNVLPAYLIMADYDTHFTGYYTDNHSTAVITGISGSGSPYLYFFGFSASVGTVINLQCDNGNIGFTNSNYTIQTFYDSNASNPTFYNIDGSSLGTYPAGILIRKDGKNIPNGTYNITIIKGIQKMTYKLIMAR